MNENELKFYQTPLLTWGLLFIYPPLGIILLWVSHHYDLLLRFFISLLFGLLYLEFLGLYSSVLRALIYSLIFSFIVYRNFRLKEYELKIHDLYTSTLNNEDIKNILANYLLKFQSPTSSYNNCLYFEVYLRNKYSHIYKHLTLSHMEDTYINFIYQESETIENIEKTIKYNIDKKKYEAIQQDIKNQEKLNEHFEKEFRQLTEVIKDKVKIPGNTFVIYFTLRLLKQYSIEYYGEIFKDKYGHEFNDINNLDDALHTYVSIESLNTHINSLDLAMFTYYLMKYGVFIDETDFYHCITQISQNITKALEKRQQNLFIKHLFTSSSEILKEIETIDIVNRMVSKERMLKYVFDLLNALGYANIVQPLNSYLDYIVTLNQHSFGVMVIYIDSKKDKDVLSNQTIQEAKLGLVYNELEKGIIITNGTFSNDAKELADKNNIILWDKDKLNEKALLVKRYYKEQERSEPTDEIKFAHISTIPFNQITIDIIDQMTDFEFQYYIAELFKIMGYRIISVNKTRDKGIDIIIEKNSLLFGIQAKKSNKKVDSNPVKEIITGLPYYNLQYGYIITNNEFNEEAKKLASVCEITLWDRKILIEKIKNDCI